MDIHFSYTPTEASWAMYQRLMKKLLPTKPLYVFLAVAGITLVVMVAQHIYNPSSRSLIFISLSLLFILFGGCILYSTKKSIPVAVERLKATIGKTQNYSIDEGEVRITADGKTETFARRRVLGQYCTDKFYVFCISDRITFFPVIVGITRDNVDELNKFIESNSSRGIKLKKLRRV